MWIMPSRNRPQLAERVFSKTKVTTPGVIAIDDDQIEMYSGLNLPENWQVVASPRSRFGPKNNEIFARFPNEPWYGSISDDMVPETQGWDSELPKTSGQYGAAWADDNLYGRAVCIAFGGELIRALGFLCCPATEHFYNDDAHELIAKEVGNGVFRSDILVPHLHFTKGLSIKDKTYEDRPASMKDRKAFEAWKEKNWPQIKVNVLKAIPC